MASDYEEISRFNRESYGIKGALKSGRLSAGLYDDRTHLIFEFQAMGELHVRVAHPCLYRLPRGWCISMISCKRGVNACVYKVVVARWAWPSRS